MHRFEDKVALVTGGSSGIGRAAALAFAAAGAKVAVAARRRGEGEETCESIRAGGGTATFISTDVVDRGQVEAMVARTVEAYGRLDYAFNNAGVEGAVAATADYTEQQWDQVLDVNLKGAWLCMKYEVTEMLKSGGGSIVNMSSGSGLAGGRGTPAYVASKHAVIGLTKAAALDYAGRGIRVNVVCPGSVVTPMHYRLWGTAPEDLRRVDDAHPAGRSAHPEEVASAVLWLCSEGASYATGLALVLDGGLTIR